ncbi:unnamed protein product [Moneuplotes crassus]|uniref:Uncharacterized protein n=1 Tax=Euplotes crassus TaxID=5936 RepID=A0AAD1USQ1_EUPCR|nr:unnamed protein product [Moneuplotes crassus]
MIGEETGFDSKVSTLLQRCDQTFTKYFEEDSRSPQESKVEQFISLCNETEELKSKLEEEEVDNQRLALKLNSLDNELSSLLVNHIGSSITQECEYVESSTEILKEKTSNCLNEADVVRNSVDDLTYGDTYKNVLLKIKDSFTRKLSEHKIEKERLIVEIEEYDSNRLHLAPLLHQYSQIMAKTREIDRQVTQLMS